MTSFFAQFSNNYHFLICLIHLRDSAEDRREYLESLLRECKKEEVAPVLDDDALNDLLARRYGVHKSAIFISDKNKYICSCCYAFQSLYR